MGKRAVIKFFLSPVIHAIKELNSLDLTIQATSGIMAVTGFPDGPPLCCGPWIGDLIPALCGLSGVLAALAEAPGKK